MFELIIYQTAQARRPFEEWLDRLRDSTAEMRITRRIRQFQSGALGDYASVGEGVFELRIHFGPGFRVYFGRSGERIVVLLCGGDKSTQHKDIERAKEYWSDWKGRQS